MSRKSLGSRLYLDPGRGQWVIRDGSNFIRTGVADRSAAEAELIKYRASNWRRSTGYIYFLTAAYPDYPVKIGFTSRMRALRIKSLQTACPYALYFLGHIDGTIAQEQEIHASFDSIRLHGEWFKSTPELRAYIQAACGATVVAA